MKDFPLQTFVSELVRVLDEFRSSGMEAQVSIRDTAVWRASGGLEGIKRRIVSSDQQDCLSALNELQNRCRVDPDVSLQSGWLGLHSHLLKLSMSTNEDVAEVAASCIASIVEHDIPACSVFPVSQVPEPPALAAPAPEKCALYLQISETDGDILPLPPTPLHLTAMELDLDSMDVLAHAVPASLQRMSGQSDVGQILWPAAPVLVRWCVAHRARLAGRKILEIGAGMGLTGIAAGLFAAVAELEARPVSARHAGPQTGRTPLMTQVVLSDYINATVLGNLKYNVALNDPLRNVSHFETLVQACDKPSLERLFAVRALDWDMYVRDEMLRAGSGNSGDGASSLTCETGVAFSSRPTLTPTASGPSSSLSISLRHSRLSASTTSLSGAVTPSAASTAAAEAEADGRSNDEGDEPADSAAAAPAAAEVGRSYVHVPRDEAYDVIIGSDMICCGNDAEGCAAVLAQHLHPDGFAVFLLPPPRTRYGVDVLPDALARRGLKLVTRPINPVFLGASARKLERDRLQGERSKGGDSSGSGSSPSTSPTDGVDGDGQPVVPLGPDLVEAPRADELVTAGGYEDRLVLHIITKK